MNYSVKKYSNWLLEQKSKRYVEKEDKTKVVFKPIDADSFLVKYKKIAIVDSKKILAGQPTIVNDKIVKPDPKYLNDGWNETLEFLLRSTEGKGPNSELLSKIEKVGTEMIAVYEVSRKLLTPNRVVVTYTLYPKSEFNPLLKDGDIKALDADTAGKYAINDRIAAKIRNRALNIDSQAEKIAQQLELEEAEAAKQKAAAQPETGGANTTLQSTGKKITVDDPGPEFKKLKYAPANLFGAIRDALEKISKYARRSGAEPEIYDNPTYLKSEEELDNSRIGDYTIAVLTALKLAWKIQTEDSKGRNVHLFNQAFADKLNYINSSKQVGESKYIFDPLGKILVESKLYEDKIFGLDDLLGGPEFLDRFKQELKNVKVQGASTTTGSATPEELAKISYPLKYGTNDSEDVKKVQKLMIDKLTNTDLKGICQNEWWYANVVTNPKYAGDGDYGSSTRGAVKFLKGGFELPSKDVDGNTITKEFVDKLYSYNKK